MAALGPEGSWGLGGIGGKDNHWTLSWSVVGTGNAIPFRPSLTSSCQAALHLIASVLAHLPRAIHPPTTADHLHTGPCLHS